MPTIFGTVSINLVKSTYAIGGIIMIRFRLKACLRCNGDLILDEGDWLCMQCGRYYYTGLYGQSSRTLFPGDTFDTDHDGPMKSDIAPDGWVVGKSVGAPDSLFLGMSDRSETQIGAAASNQAGNNVLIQRAYQ